MREQYSERGRGDPMTERKSGERASECVPSSIRQWCVRVVHRTIDGQALELGAFGKKIPFRRAQQSGSGEGEELKVRGEEGGSTAAAGGGPRIHSDLHSQDDDAEGAGGHGRRERERESRQNHQGSHNFVAIRSILPHTTLPYRRFVPLAGLAWLWPRTRSGAPPASRNQTFKRTSRLHPHELAP
jgi:hypothetical protein